MNPAVIFVGKIRSSAQLKNLPVIVVSDVVKLSEIFGILEHGTSRLLPKAGNVPNLRGYFRAFLPSGMPKSAAPVPFASRAAVSDLAIPPRRPA